MTRLQEPPSTSTAMGDDGTSRGISRHGHLRSPASRQPVSLLPRPRPEGDGAGAAGRGGVVRGAMDLSAKGLVSLAFATADRIRASTGEFMCAHIRRRPDFERFCASLNSERASRYWRSKHARLSEEGFVCFPGRETIRATISRLVAQVSQQPCGASSAGRCRSAQAAHGPTAAAAAAPPEQRPLISGGRPCGGDPV